jgi:hypothetical protein
MKLYTVVIHYLQMCMNEYGCCPKFGRGDNLTYTLKYVLYGEMGLYAQLFLNGSLDLNETFPQVVIHCPKLCMKEYGSCQKFGR